MAHAHCGGGVLGYLWRLRVLVRSGMLCRESPFTLLSSSSQYFPVQTIQHARLSHAHLPFPPSSPDIFLLGRFYTQGCPYINVTGQICRPCMYALHAKKVDIHALRLAMCQVNVTRHATIQDPIKLAEKGQIVKDLEHIPILFLTLSNMH